MIDGLQLRWLRDPELDIASTLTVRFELLEQAVSDGAVQAP